MRLCLRRRLGFRPKLGPLHTALLCLFRGCHIRLQLQMMSKVSAWKMQLKVPSWCVLSLVSIRIRLARTHIFSIIFGFCAKIVDKIRWILRRLNYASCHFASAIHIVLFVYLVVLQRQIYRWCEGDYPHITQCLDLGDPLGKTGLAIR